MKFIKKFRNLFKLGQGQKLQLGPSGEVGICDQCLNDGIKETKPVRRILDDNVYFCKEHYEGYQEKMTEECQEDVAGFLRSEK